MARRQRRANKGKDLITKRGQGWVQLNQVLWVHEKGLLCGRHQSPEHDKDSEKWNLLDNKGQIIKTFKISADHQSRKKKVKWLISNMIPFSIDWLKENPLEDLKAKSRSQLCLTCGKTRTMARACACNKFMNETKEGQEIRGVIEKYHEGNYVFAPAPGEATDYILHLRFDDVQGLPPEGKELEEAIEMGEFIDIKIKGPVFRTAINKAKAHERGMEKICKKMEEIEQ